MAYNQDNNPLSGVSMFGPSANIFKKKANNNMKVRINPNKYIKRGGELSSYAKDHITKTNKRGKVTIEVPKSEMNSNESKLFDTSIQKWTSAPYGKSPSQQPTAKDFKKQRNKDRVMKTAAGFLTGIVGGGGGVLSALQNRHVGGSMSVDDTPDDPSSTYRKGMDREGQGGPTRREIKKEEREKNKANKALRKNTKPQSKRSKKKAIKRNKNNAQYKSDVKGDGICTKSTCLADPVTGVKNNPTKKR